MLNNSRVHLCVDFVSDAVEVFYRRALADPALAPWFADLDLHGLRAHQTEFLLAALGGAPHQATRPERLREELVRAHQGLGIDRAAFDLAVEHLAEALRWAGMGEEQLAESLALLRRFAAYVVEPDERAATPMR